MRNGGNKEIWFTKDQLDEHFEGWGKGEGAKSEAGDLLMKQLSAGNPPKYERRLVAATQSSSDIKRHEAYRRRTAAFEEWRQKLNYSDRLPRGKFFKDKKPGRKLFVIDELWHAFS